MRLWFVTLLLMSNVGCLFGEKVDPEGANPGECVDGADNDGDGDYDCNDRDCTGAPDCSESDTDTDESDTDTDDSGTDTDDPITSSTTAQGQLLVEPNFFDFGECFISWPTSVSVNVTNVGDGDLLVNSVIVDGDAVFSIVDEPSDRLLSAGSSLEFFVAFAPESDTSYQADVTVETDAGTDTMTVIGSGTFQEP